MTHRPALPVQGRLRSTVNTHPELWPVFIKPFEDKAFTGVLVRSPKDLMGCGRIDEDLPIYCSEPVHFIGEWRCFVRYGRILDVRHYKGRWQVHPDCQLIERAVQDYTSAPAGYSMVFGLTEQGKTLLIEINDGYSLGSYGLFYLDYAELLSARWAELTGTEDECRF